MIHHSCFRLRLQPTSKQLETRAGQPSVHFTVGLHARMANTGGMAASHSKVVQSRGLALAQTVVLGWPC